MTAALLAALTPAASARPPVGHWCRQGDPPLYASMRTTCGFAGKIITKYVNKCHEAPRCHLHVHDSRTRRWYRIACRRTGSHVDGVVSCTGPRDTDIWTRFSALI
jgi:hypothetical protein